MSFQQTMDKLKNLKLNGFVCALQEQMQTTSAHTLAFEDRLALLVDAEGDYRNINRENRLRKAAKFKHTGAYKEDVDYVSHRGLDRSAIESLFLCHWIKLWQNIFLIGPTGTGKSWLACALGNEAIRNNHKVRFYRFPQLLEDMDIARKDGTLPHLRGQLVKLDLLIIDDWAVCAINSQGRHDFLEIVEHFYNKGALIITTQLPLENWHEYLGEPTQADSILDRIVHNAHQISIKGESMRKLQGLKGGQQ
jgi:DNA replication protein DnaC